MGEKIELYRPSNGTDGEMFMSSFCYQCSKWRDDPDAKTQCSIAASTMFWDIDDPKYPKQWRYVDGQPTCTAFDSREERNAKRRGEHKKARCKNAVDMFDGV